MWPVLWFLVAFRSFPSTLDLLTIVSDQIAWVFNRFGATWVVLLGISKAFNRVLHASLLYKLKSYEILGQLCGFISSFHSNR